MGREWEGYGREWEVAPDMEKWSPADEDALRKRAECSFCSVTCSCVGVWKSVLYTFAKLL